MQSIRHTFVPNNKLYDDPFFLLPVRASARERIKRHSFHFVMITTSFSFGYHLMTLDIKFTLKKIAQCFVHKGIIGYIFFYGHELVWSRLYNLRQKQPLLQNRQKRIPNWSSCILTSFILFPLFIGLNFMYKMPIKKKVMRSLVDVLLLNALALQFERNLRRKKKVFLKGKLEDLKKQIHIDQI